MKVSVIVPNYNHEKFLSERLFSVLNQTYIDFEVIILDDNSQDNSKDIIERYRGHDKVSHIIYNKENSGSTFKQWEKGINLAQGEWIWIAESDDVASLSFLEEMMSVVLEQPNVVIAQCASIVIDENSNEGDVEKWAHAVTSRDWSQNYISIGKDEVRDVLFCRNTIPNASAVIFKKSLVSDELLNTIQNMRYAGDWLFWSEILALGDFYYVAKPFNYFRHHGATTRIKKNDKLEEKRFNEYFYILRHMKTKYNLDWNIGIHKWILDDYLSKINMYLLRQIAFIFPVKYCLYIYKVLISSKIR